MLIKITYDFTRFVRRAVRNALDNASKTPRERFLEKSVDHADFVRRCNEWERNQYLYSSSLGRMGSWNH